MDLRSLQVCTFDEVAILMSTFAQQMAVRDIMNQVYLLHLRLDFESDTNTSIAFPGYSSFGRCITRTRCAKTDGYHASLSAYLRTYMATVLDYFQRSDESDKLPRAAKSGPCI